jgi:uncharacterized protein
VVAVVSAMTNNANWRTAILERHRWMVFLLPFVVYMLVGSLEPTPDKPGGGSIGLTIPYAYYPWLYAVKIAMTIATVLFVWPAYRNFPAGVTLLAIAVGIVGGVLWIGICRLDLEHRYLGPWEQKYVLPITSKIGMGSFINAGDRPAFNPFEHIADQPAWAWAFLAVRFLGLVAVVPVIEEFFLRGFLMRFVVEPDWWNVPFGNANALAIVLGTAVPMMTHPAELLAAAVWFSMITWLMLRTRNIWDCVAAHAITNLILGVYVVSTNTWRLM